MKKNDTSVLKQAVSTFDKLLIIAEKKFDALWQRAIEREREIENRKKATAVIYVEANHNKGKACEDCLDLREEFCREYCTRENLEVLRVFRETSESPDIPSQFDEIQKFIEQHKDISFLVHLHHLVGGSVVVAADLRKASG
jgi:predicted adenine nucleotide alpha hydrolase (AANH) superfamily ATPase